MKKLFTLAIIVFSLNTSAQISQTGLIFSLPFNGNINDESGNGNNGVLNGAILTTDRFGQENKAYYFDGENDFISINPNSDFSKIGDFTFSVWANCEGWDIQSGETPFDRQVIFDGSSNDEITNSDFFREGIKIQYDYLGSTSEIQYLQRYSSLNTDVFVNKVQQTNGLLNNWHNLVFVRSGSTTYNYVDGILISINTTNSDTLNMHHNLYIGTFSGNNPNYINYNYNFKGKIDDVLFYNRALSSQDIQNIYQENPIITQENIEARFPWYFGNYAGVSFKNDGTVKPLTNGKISTQEGVASISDINGNLLFYSDGLTIWDKTHTPMPNANGDLNGNWSSTESATIVPNPVNTNQYYVFTLDELAGYKGFSYSIVDMTLNGNGSQIPLGDVVLGQKNIQLLTPCTEKIEIICGYNNDYWIVVHGWNNNNFYSYKLDANGLNTVPIITSIGAIHTGSTNTTTNGNAVGYMKVSPQYNKIALANRSNNCIDVFDFNISTGVVSNELNIHPVDPSIIDGLEFSPNGKYIFFASRRLIERYSFETNSAITIAIDSASLLSASNVAIRALQIGPDNNIYVSILPLNYLSKIENPESVNPILVVNSIFLNVDNQDRYCKYGLPAIFYPAPQLPIVQISQTCSNDTIMLTASSNVNGSFLWNTGETTSSIFVPKMNKTYSVTVSYDGNTATDSISINPMTATVTKSDIFCENNCIGTASVNVLGGFAPYNFKWENGETNSSIQNLCAGNYLVTISDSLGCSLIENVSILANYLSSISGIVQYSGGLLTNGEAEIILYSSTTDNGMGHQKYATTLIDSTNSFTFNNIPAGNYYIKVDFTNNQSYPNMMNSYYDSTHVWAKAKLVPLNCDTAVNLIVNMYEFPVHGNGNGHIEGHVNGSNNQKSTSSPVCATITLVSSTNQVIASTTSDEFGFYSFDNIPEGNYSILIDIPGLAQQETYSVTINPEIQTVADLNFIVKSVEGNYAIYQDVILNTENIQKFEIQTYPNPFKNSISIEQPFTFGTIEIIDFKGSVIKIEGFNENQFNLDLSNFENGIYNLNVRNNDGLILSHKILKIE